MGADIKKLIPIFDFYSSPGASNEKVHYFCGIVDSTGMTRVCGLKEECEDISVDVYALDDLIQMVADNKIKELELKLNFQKSSTKDLANSEIRGKSAKQ